MKKLLTIITMALILGSVAQADETSIKSKIINIAVSKGWKLDTNVDKADNKLYFTKRVKQKIHYDKFQAEVSYTNEVASVTSPCSKTTTNFRKLHNLNCEIRKLKNAIKNELGTSA